MITTKQQTRRAPIDIEPEIFRQLGYRMIDRITEYMTDVPTKPVSDQFEVGQIRSKLVDISFPETGQDISEILEQAMDLLFENSVHSANPRFWGYISGTPAPIGALGDLLAASVNQNVGGAMLSPMATEIEAQTIRWLGELVGYGSDCGGLLVSGGTVANFVPFVAARHKKAPWSIRKHGFNAPDSQQLRVYTSEKTHTWVDKAADLFGIGTDNICFIPTDNNQKLKIDELQKQLQADIEAGYLPFMVVGTAGSTGTGAIDPLREIADIATQYDLWFHIDGAYGATAGVLGEDAPADFAALKRADSVALDPHKWMYVPLEAGAVLVRDEQNLIEAFSHHPDYLPDTAKEIFYHEYGFQTSRAFRALKVWLAMRQVGKQGYKQMIAEDIRLAQTLYQLTDEHSDLDAMTTSLSITTFRYVPHDLRGDDEATEAYLNELNKAMVQRFHHHPDAYLSNAIVHGKYVMRVCIVNFRTSMKDIAMLPELAVQVGQETDRELRQKIGLIEDKMPSIVNEH